MQWKDKWWWAQVEIQEMPFKHKKKTFLKWGCLKVDAGCPEGLWLAACLHPCSHSNLGKQLWLTLLGAQAGLDDTQRSLPASVTPQLCEKTHSFFSFTSVKEHTAVRNRVLDFLGCAWSFHEETTSGNDLQHYFPRAYFLRAKCKFSWVKYSALNHLIIGNKRNHTTDLKITGIKN